MTIEPTASFWDCGEFISSAYKLEVGHPPGNPIFMLVANIFTHFASDTMQISKMVNTMSALFSALTILFLFWTITHLVRKVVCPDDKPFSLAQLIIIMGSGVVGALAYTFSDTFWFSAVEGEVYAFSSLMTALVFWLILKWEEVADQPHADRWLILIAYLMGLSIAVHLLNLLCIPAIVLVYYFKKKENPTLWGAVGALLISFGIIAAILYGLVQGLVEVAGWFELLCVNVLGMTYNSGVVVYVILIFGVLSWSIWETMREKPHAVRMKIAFIVSITLLGIPFIGSGYVLGILIILALTVYLFGFSNSYLNSSKFKLKINPSVLNTILLSLLVITIGYSSYALILIRSEVNPPMDQNSPEDIFTLRDYLAREQYGQTPLFYGETYVSDVKRVPEDRYCVPVQKDGGPIWSRVIKRDDSEPDRYYISGRKMRYEYVDELSMFFPRMYSKDSRHIDAYKEWANVKGKKISVRNCSEPQMVVKPTFLENLRFFFAYQVNFMYWRYFMWNFSGRQNDIQGNGDVCNGNWITGFKFIDQYLAGPQEDMPDDIVNNKGHNKYYMLPLLLGILGLLFQVYAGKNGTQGFWVTFMLFFMTGLAIVIYLNQTPYQPRERDYAYAGSFYAFAIWIGLGVAGLANLLNKYLTLKLLPASLIASCLCLIVPVIMANENWDDHDRSKRYVCRDFGYNYLSTCAPNAVIFTNGDNDTFPLWYSQEVEGYRTDVRVCNLSYLQTDWYIDQMKRQAYESEPLPIDWTRAEYVQGKHDMAYIYDLTENPISVEVALDWVKSDDVRYKKAPGVPGEMDFIPSSKLTIPVDSTAVISAGIVKPENVGWIPNEMLIDLGAKPDREIAAKRMLGKDELMILDMLKNNKDWSRPIYYASTVSPEKYLRLENYFRQEGIAYRIVPFNTTENKQTVDTDLMYDNMMNKYRWGNIQDPDIYLDENTLRMAHSFRIMFNKLADALIDEEKKDKAEQVLDYSREMIPDYTVPFDYSALGMAESYHRLGNVEKSLEVFKIIAERTAKSIRWYKRMSPKDFASAISSIVSDVRTMNMILMMYQQIDPKLMDPYLQDYNEVTNRYTQLMSKSHPQQGAPNL
jgi:hypothetical protein